MATQWPLVKAWLVGVIPTLGISDLTVQTGPPVSGSAAQKYVTVGYVADDSGGTYQRMESYDGTSWDETGDVRSQIVSQAGSLSQQADVEASAFAVADALDARIRSDHTLGGLLSANGTVDTTVEVHSITNGNGIATALVYVLRYTTTT
jgi:hypothetical protein